MYLPGCTDVGASADVAVQSPSLARRTSGSSLGFKRRQLSLFQRVREWVLTEKKFHLMTSWPGDAITFPYTLDFDAKDSSAWRLELSI